MPEQFDAPTVNAFVLDRIRGCSSEYARLLGSALRSFFRFLNVRGKTSVDLSFAVTAVRRWRQATVPAFLTPEQVERVLSTTDRAIPCGCRDYAVLLLLGHESTETTQVYLHADMNLKERALAHETSTGATPVRYRPPDPLLAFLESL